MKKSTIGTGVFGVLSALAVALAGAAAAAPTGGASASDTVKALRDMGYAVQLNGALSGPLSMCTVTGVHGRVQHRCGTAVRSCRTSSTRPTWTSTARRTTER